MLLRRKLHVRTVAGTGLISHRLHYYFQGVEKVVYKVYISIAFTFCKQFPMRKHGGQQHACTWFHVTRHPLLLLVYLVSNLFVVPFILLFEETYFCEVSICFDCSSAGDSVFLKRFYCNNNLLALEFYFFFCFYILNNSFKWCPPILQSGHLCTW